MTKRESSAARIQRLQKQAEPLPELPRDKLVSPGAPNTIKPWEGRLSRKPWEYEVTAVIPHCNTPDLLTLCIALLRAQTVRPYIVVVDTGTEERLLPQLLALRAADVEVHQINCHGTPRSADVVSYAMDLGQAVCRTRWMFTVHSDCLLVDRRAIEDMRGLAEKNSVSAVGYQSIPRESCDWWKGMVSHTCTLFDVQTLDTYEATWSIRRLIANRGGSWNDVDKATRPDTEVAVNETLREFSEDVLILGEETWGEIERDSRRVHLRQFTSHTIHGRSPPRFADQLPGLLNELCEMAATYGQPVPADVRSRLTNPQTYTQGREFTEGDKAVPPALGAILPPKVEPVEPKPAAPLARSWQVKPATGRTVTFIAPVYQYFPVLLPSLLAQTHKDWRLLLIHDGPQPDWLNAQVRALADDRVSFAATELRHNDYGHSLRRIGVNALAGGYPADFVVHTNGDNYYVPGFCETMLAHLNGNPESVAAVCDSLHNYWKWEPMRSVLERGHVDCGCVAVRRAAAVELGWPSSDHSADYQWLKLMADRYGMDKLHRVPGFLFVHN